MAAYFWVIIGSGNGFLPGGTKQLLKPMLTIIDGFCATEMRAISQEVLLKPICNF